MCTDPSNPLFNEQLSNLNLFAKIGSAVFSAANSYNKSRSEADIQKKQWEESNRLKNQRYEFEKRQLEEKQAERNRLYQEQLTENAREARQERARLRVAAGESGLGGSLTDQIMAESYGNEARDMSILEANRANDIADLQTEKYASLLRNKTTDLYIDEPNPLGSALSAALGITGAYTDKLSKDAKNKAKDKTKKVQ